MSTLHILGVLAASAIVLKLAVPAIRPWQSSLIAGTGTGTWLASESPFTNQLEAACPEIRRELENRLDARPHLERTMTMFTCPNPHAGLPPHTVPANGILQPYENFQHLQQPSGHVLPDPGKVAA